MIVKNVILTDEQRKGFILLANSPDPFGNYLYSSELDLIMNKQTGALMTYYWDDKPDGYYYQQGVVFLKDINGEKNVRLIELI